MMQEETFRYQLLISDEERNPLAAVLLHGGGDAAFFDVHLMPKRERVEFEAFLEILKNFLGATRVEVPPPQGDTTQ
jgi:hypothetical protein